VAKRQLFAVFIALACETGCCHTVTPGEEEALVRANTARANAAVAAFFTAERAEEETPLLVTRDVHASGGDRIMSADDPRLVQNLPNLVQPYELRQESGPRVSMPAVAFVTTDHDPWFRIGRRADGSVIILQLIEDEVLEGGSTCGCVPLSPIPPPPAQASVVYVRGDRMKTEIRLLHYAHHQFRFPGRCGGPPPA
jgi:hypothetical protein